MRYARFKMTEAGAERVLELMDKLSASGQRFPFVDDKYYRELLEAIRDNGGISMGEEEPLLERHTVVVPASVFGLPENSCTGIAKTIVL